MIAVQREEGSEWQNKWKYVKIVFHAQRMEIMVWYNECIVVNVLKLAQLED